MAMDIGGQAQGQSGYYTNAATSVKPRATEGLSNTLDVQIKRLSEIAARLEQISNDLYGPVPEAAGIGEPGRPMPNVASRTRDLGDLIGRVENAVTRIQGGL